MPRFAANHVPSYRLHKQSGQAIVTIARRDYLLGRHGSSQSRDRYNNLLATWFAAGKNAALMPDRTKAADEAGGIRVVEVLAAFWRHAKNYYRDSDGVNTGELDNFTHALRVLRKLHAKTPASAFGPACLRACQAELVRQGLARKTINRRIGRIRQVFRWAVSQELVPPSVMEGLRAVDGLKRGRTEARETAPVRPVAHEHARAAMAQANRHIAAMIELQLLTGMRSGEMVIMRTADIDRAGPVWVYTPTKHKTQHHGHTRTIYIGARGQEILTSFLKMDPTAYVFSPAEADAERRAAASAARKTPISCGNVPGSNRRRKPARSPGDRYTPGSYAGAVAKACDKAFPPPASLARQDDETLAAWAARLSSKQTAALKAWKKSHRFHPHQLRHAAATRFRRDYNLETARALLGQKSMDAAEIYAEMDMGKAREVMARIG